MPAESPLDPIPPASGWYAGACPYQHLIHAEEGDSKYLREKGLKPNILALLANRSLGNTLDVGCGDGWLFDALQPATGIECDITREGHRQRRWPFFVEDVTALTFASGTFDTIVASLLLMWTEHLHRACSELARVASRNARLVVSITHPASYRIGRVAGEGDYLVERDYQQPFVLPDLYIANRVGPLAYYHRPLSDYVSALLASGWRLQEFREWSIDMEDYRRHFAADSVASGPRRTSRLPLYAFFRCEKESP